MTAPDPSRRFRQTPKFARAESPRWPLARASGTLWGLTAPFRPEIFSAAIVEVRLVKTVALTQVFEKTILARSAPAMTTTRFCLTDPADFLHFYATARLPAALPPWGVEPPIRSCLALGNPAGGGHGPFDQNRHFRRLTGPDAADRRQRLRRAGPILSPKDCFRPR